MKMYDVAVLKQSEIVEKFGKEIQFSSNGFMKEQKIDFWNGLERLLQKPIVSIRSSGRPGWNEILVLLANGTVNGDKIVLDYQTESDYRNVLMDIFAEFAVDEYEVFDHYSGTCSEEMWESISNWVHETW